jgi:hypothetical protein
MRLGLTMTEMGQAAPIGDFFPGAVILRAVGIVSAFKDIFFTSHEWFCTVTRLQTIIIILIYKLQLTW